MSDGNKKIDLSKFGKNSIIIGLIFLITIAIVFMSSLTVIKNQISKEIKNNLTSVLHTTHTSITNWSTANLKHAHQVTHNSAVITEVKELLKLTNDEKALKTSPSLSNLRKLFDHYIEDNNYLGFFIVSPENNINIASMRNNNIGIENLLSGKKNYLENIFNGQSQLILPIKTDVPLVDKRGNLSKKEPTMFLGVPIKNEKDNVIAAFLVRVNPAINFTNITEIARRGETGESYLFNKNGLLLTESRFDSQLIQIGLIGPSERGILNVRIKDPGGNMLKGYKPKNTDTLPFTKLAHEALKGNSGINIEGYRDYRGVQVVGAWLWDSNFNFALATETNYSEAFNSYNEIKDILVFAFSASTLLFAILTITIINKNNDTLTINKQLSREILERTQTEVMLTNSQKRIELLLNSTAEAIYGIDNFGKCIFANNVCASILGYDSPTEFIGKNMHSLIHYKKNDGTPYPEEDFTIFKSLKENQDFHSDKEVLWKKDGTSFPAEFWSHVIETDGIINGAVVTFFDITEKQQTRRALEISENRLIEAQEIAHIGSWDWNMITGELIWSDEIYRIFGLQPQSVPATYAFFLDAVHPDDRDLVTSNVNDAIEKKNKYDIDHRVVRPSGEIRTVHETAEVFYNSDNEPYRMLGVVQDTTDRKKFERALSKAKTTAESASKAKSEFLASMSHELRTPMNAILGMTSLLEQTNLSDIQKEYIDGLNSSGKTLLEIISDILDISKIEAGKLTLDKAEFNLLELIDETCKVLSIKAFTKNLEFFSNIESSIPTTISGDGLRLKQILINLIGNAIKFTDKGEVSLTVSPEYIENDELTILFSIKDSGIGIKQEKIESIFEKFSQADSSTTRKYGGTGLGLDISKKIVGLMGGELRASSVVGLGSTFSFTAKFDVPKNSTTLIDSIDLKNNKMLVLTKNETLNKIICNYLSAVDIEPTPAYSTEETLELIKNNKHFDLAIVDSATDQNSELETIKNLKSKLPNIGIILAVTPDKGKDIIKKANSFGVEHFLTKPVAVQSLYSKILSIVNNEVKEKTLVAKKLISKNNNKKILLVEDDKISRLYASKVLENNGYKITTATNGLEAIQYSANSTHDLILMDVSMPEMDGLDATKAIRKNEKATGKRTPVIALTAFTQAEDRRICLDSGMDDYLTKPIDQKKLLNILDKYIGKEETKEVKNPEDVESDSDKPFILKKEKIIEQAAGDMELIKEVSEIFINESNNTMESLEKSINKKDLEATEKFAHFIKGRLAFFGYEKAVEVANKIEILAKNKQIKNTKNLYHELLNSVTSLKNELMVFIKENN